MVATFQLWKYHRETNTSLTFKAVTASWAPSPPNTKAPFWSQSSGYIGLAPWTADTDGSSQHLNFMKQLQSNNLITNNVVSIYTDTKTGNSSIVKFGGWDEAGIKNSNSSLMQMLRTKTNWEWVLNGAVITMGNQ